ncbi:MAG: trypsin-like peptidase domain-containing protein [Luteolibacter sp.]
MLAEPKTGAHSISEDELNNIEVYEKTSPGVVNITSTSLAYNVFSFRPIPQSGTGSGVIIDDAGHIVTNHHVIQGAESLEVTLADKSSHAAKIVGDDPNNDLAILQIDVPKERLSPIPLGTSKGLKVGEKVLAIGNPYRLDRSLTTGIISSLGRSIEGGNGRIIEGVIQTDASINPGNSGGPLLNTSGEVIGINSAIVSSANGGNTGIGFAIPVDTVRRISNDLITLGYVRRPYMGITNELQLTDYPPLAALLGVPAKGLIVLEVKPGSAAAKAGIIAAREGIVRNNRGVAIGGVPVGGDVILALDGSEVNTAVEFATAIDRHKAGDKVTVTILRGTQTMKVPITLQEAAPDNR